MVVNSVRSLQEREESHEVSQDSRSLRRAVRSTRGRGGDRRHRDRQHGQCEADGAGNYVLGVSNTLVGNGWREEMICAVKAQALASGKV